MSGILILMSGILILVLGICLILMSGILILMSSILIFIWLPFLISWRPTIDVLLLISSFITYPPCVSIFKPLHFMCFSNIPKSGSVTHSSLHLLHGHLISVLLFHSMSFVAHCIHLPTVISLSISRTMIAYVHGESNTIIYHGRRRLKNSG